MDLAADDVVEMVMEKVLEETLDEDREEPNQVKIQALKSACNQVQAIEDSSSKSDSDPEIGEDDIEISKDLVKHEKQVLKHEKELLKIESEREKLKQEYLEQIEKRKQMEDEARENQLAIAKRLEEIRLVGETRKREEARKTQIDMTKKLEDLEKSNREARKRYEAKRRQLAVSKKIEKCRLIEEKKKQEEIEKKKKEILESLYKDQQLHKWLYTSNSFLKKNWLWKNPLDIASSTGIGLRLRLEEIYFKAPIQLLTVAIHKLEQEMIKMRQVIRRRVAEGREPWIFD